jgi:hypothetical protein
MHRNIAIAVSSLALLGVLVAGCGSGSDSVDKATFVKQVDTICEKTSGRLTAQTQALVVRLLSSETPQSKRLVAIINQVVIPGLEREVMEIRELGSPDEDEKQIQRFLAKLTSAIGFARSEPAAFANAESPDYDAAEIAGRKFGLTECPITPVETN